MVSLLLMIQSSQTHSMTIFGNICEGLSRNISGKQSDPTGSLADMTSLFDSKPISEQTLISIDQDMNITGPGCDNLSQLAAAMTRSCNLTV